MPLLLGVAMLARARVVNDWSLRLNRDLFGWEPGRLIRLYGLVVTAGVGLVMALMGLALLVGGADFFGG